MGKTDGHSKDTGNGIDPLEKFRRGTVGWSRSGDEVWKDMEAGIDRIVRTNRHVPVIRRFRYLAAAVFLALTGIASFLVLYAKEYSTPVNQTSSVVLPDGSSINLGPNTRVSWHPFTWKLSRKVNLNGEAFFDVEAGSKFTVVSDPGITEVMGTTFNILTSENIYEVTCFTGRVKVTASETGDAVIITGEQRVSLAGSGRLEVESEVQVEEVTAWTRGEFFFTSEPLGEVLAKIGRSYGAEIMYDAGSDLSFTGNFKKEKDIEIILENVITPFGLRYEKMDETKYRVFGVR